MKKIMIIFTLLIILINCRTDADIASYNLAMEAEMFQIDRRIIFYNGITDTYMLTIEGKCSIDDMNNQLEVTCKTGESQYMKHFLGLSDNVTYFAEQLHAANVSVYHYKVVFKPTIIIPNVDISTQIAD